MPAIIPIVGFALAVEFPAYGAFIAIASNVLYGVVSAAEAARDRKDLLDRSRRDNLTMVRSGEAPHRVVYGRARVSGPIVFTHSTGENNGNLYVVVALTGHEVDAIEEIVFNETNIGVTSGAVLLNSAYFSQTLRLMSEYPHVLQGPSGDVFYVDDTGEVLLTLDANRQATIPVVANLATVVAVINGADQIAPDNTEFFGGLPLLFTVSGNTIQVGTPSAFNGMIVRVLWKEWAGSPLVDVASFTGTATQPADDELVGASGGRWTPAHQLKGRAYVRARLLWNTDKFLTGIPNISARVRGRKIFDPRDSSTKWSQNPALCIRDYLTNDQFGMGCDVSELDEASFIAAANVCDEDITVDTGLTSDPAAWRAILDEAVQDGTWREITQSVVHGFTDLSGLTLRNAGSLAIDTTTWTGFSSLKVISQSGSFSSYVTLDYLGNVADGSVELLFFYPTTTNGIGINFRRQASPGSGDNYTGYRVQIALNAVQVYKVVAGVFTPLGSAAAVSAGSAPSSLKIDFTGNNFRAYFDGVLKVTTSDPLASYSDGAVEIISFANPTSNPNWFTSSTVKVSGSRVYTQKRYTTNGSFTVDRAHVDVLSGLLSSCAGMLSYTGGTFRLVAGAYQTPTLTLSETDLRGDIIVLPRKPRRELFNAVRGVYAGRGTFDQPTDYAPVTNAAYEAADGGEQFPTDLQFEFTDDALTAQRIAKIHLEKHRQGIVVQAPCKLTALPLRPGDTVMLSIAAMGWTAKVFRVEGWTLRCDEDYGVDLVLQEEAAANYDWDLGDATAIDPAPDTNLVTSTGAATDTALLLTMQPFEEEDVMTLMV